MFGEEYFTQTREIFGEDPYPYGVSANRKMMENLIDYPYEQSLIPSKPKMEDLFTSNTLEL